MKNWEKKLEECAYTLPGNGKVVDDKDAEEIAGMIINETIQEVIDKLKEHEHNPGVKYAIEELKKMKV